MPRAPKKCGRSGCEERVPGGVRYCTEHKAEAQARPNTTKRGYGADHQAARKKAILTFRPGQPCVRCHEPITLLRDVDLDHTDDRGGYLGLAHARCNARAGGHAKASRSRSRATT